MKLSGRAAAFRALWLARDTGGGVGGAHGSGMCARAAVVIGQRRVQSL